MLGWLLHVAVVNTFVLDLFCKKKNVPLPSEISPEIYVFNIAESESEARKFLSHTIFLEK
jgi:hypothetical protein